MGLAKRKLNELIAEVGSALSVDGIGATYGWPEEWKNLPIVTYSLAGATDKDRDLNNLVVGYVLTYNIDIWCKSPVECVSLFLKVEDALSALGYVCVNQGTIYEDRSRHHMRATATGYYDVVQNKVR